MKLCWDNIESVYLTKNGNLKKYEGILWIVKECKYCGEEFLAQKRSKGLYCDKSCSGKDHIGENNSFYGKIHTEETLKILSIPRPTWKTEYKKNNIPIFDTYAHQIEWAEDVRRNNEDINILEVRCTYCGKWFVPKIWDVQNRIKAMNGYKGIRGECRFYCSNFCKSFCSIYGRRAEDIMREDKARANGYLDLGNEVQSQLRRIVLERDDWVCLKCGVTKSLHCHHIDPIISNPIESADVDNCITLCVECHKEAHKQEGCGYNELRKCININ